jgi:hypothetical protein
MSERIITPDQLREGCLTSVGMIGCQSFIRHDWKVLQTLADGNLVVQEPVIHDEFHHTPRCNTGGCHD